MARILRRYRRIGVIDDQLRAPIEEIGERKSAIRPLELVRLFHALPGQFAALAAQRIARAGEGFFVGQVRPAGRDPIIMRDDFVRFHAVLRLFDPGVATRHPGRTSGGQHGSAQSRIAR